MQRSITVVTTLWLALGALLIPAPGTASDLDGFRRDGLSAMSPGGHLQKVSGSEHRSGRHGGHGYGKHGYRHRHGHGHHGHDHGHHYRPHYRHHRYWGHGYGHAWYEPGYHHDSWDIILRYRFH